MGPKPLMMSLLAALVVMGCGGARQDAAANSVNISAVRDSIRKARGTTASAASATTTATATSGAIAVPPVESAVQRESFEYAGGTRDPFASLVSLKATGPSIDNLQLVASASTGVHVSHPLFVIWDQNLDPTPDPVDSFSNLDETVYAG